METSAKNTLSSWKEIASHFGRSVRTVQRWEAQEGLPVRRVLGAVHAETSELDAWWRRQGESAGAETEREDPHGAEPAPAPRASAPAAPETRTHRRAGTLGLLALCCALAGLTAQWSHKPAVAVPGHVRLEVLPFENLTGDEQQQYIGDGFSEELLATLGGLSSQLAVIRRGPARSPSTAQAGASSGRRVGRFEADYVVEGSVRRQGDRLRVTVSLARVHDQTYVWTRTYERDLQHLFEVQSDIAGAVAAELRATNPLVAQGLAAPEPARGSEARDAYLLGRHYWNQRTPEGFGKAIASFEQALAQDPNDDLSYVGLADAYNLMATYWLMSPRQALERVRAATAAAIRLNERRAQAHAATGYALDVLEWRFDEARQAFQRAIDLNPSYAPAHQWQGSLLKRLGRFAEAELALQRAAALDPDVMAPQVELGDYWWTVGQPERARAAFERGLAFSPQSARAHILYGSMLLGTGEEEAGLAHVRSAYELSGRDAGHTAFLVYALARARRRAEAQELWRRSASEHGARPFNRALVAMEFGRPQEALDLLERAVGEHDISLCVLAVTPLFDPLRAEPRFAALLARLRLPVVVQPRATAARPAGARSPRSSSPRASARA